MRLRLLAGVLLLGADALIAGAQAVPPRGVIDGMVTDTSLAPLANVTVSIVGSDVRVLTGTSGRFRMTDLPAGRYALLAVRVGYAAVSAGIVVAERDTVRPSLTMTRVANQLDTVAVTGKIDWRMTEFDMRRKYGEGQFLTQAEIEKRSVAAVSDLLANFKGVYVDPGGDIWPRRSPGQTNRMCHFQIYLDGVKMPPDEQVNRVTSPTDLAGIEVYLGAATIPLEYKPTSGGGFCGVILLWNKVGH